MLDGNAVEKITELVENASDPRLIDGYYYSARPQHQVPPPKEPSPSPLRVHTLGALVGYLEANQDALGLGDTLIHVESPELVRAVSALEERTQQRHAYLEAGVRSDHYPWGGYLPVEEMVILLQHRFVDNGDRARALQLVGTVKDEQVRTQSDDGVTQTVTVKGGVTLVGDVEVRNPFSLAPYRTFVEIEQPLSPFILRARTGRGGVEWSLFEADGGAWRLEAIERIRAWLSERLDDWRIIG